MHLTRKQPFKQFGRIYFDEAKPEKSLDDIESYIIGKLTPQLSNPFPEVGRYKAYAVDPCERIQDLWQKAHDAMDKEMDDQFGCRASPEDSPSGWGVEELQAIIHARITKKGDLIAIGDDLLQIIQLFEIPTALAQPCLVPMDFAFRNIMYEEGEVSAFLDWDDVAVLPSVLIAHYPDELEPSYINVPPGRSGHYLSSAPNNIVNDLHVLTNKPSGSWCTSDSHGEENLLFSIEESRVERWQQIFFQFLRLTARQTDNNPDSGTSRKDDDDSLAMVTNNLAAYAQLCKDAYRIHMLLQGDYVVWIQSKDWITSKLAELKGKRRNWPLRLSGSSLW